MKQENYAMRYMGIRPTYEVLTTEVVSRIFKRTKSFNVQFPRRVVVYSNGVFTVAIVQPKDNHDPDRVYIGVSKKCDRDFGEIAIGTRVATVRACKAYMIGERDHKQRERDILKPSHGNCCTCQTCGKHHDDCICEGIEEWGAEADPNAPGADDR